MKTNLLPILQNIAEDVLSLICLTMDKEGIPLKYFDDDLSYTIEAVRNPVITFMFDGYMSYWQNSASSTFAPLPSVSELRDWALNKGLSTDNETLRIVSKALYTMSIAPQSILSLLDNQIENAFESEWAEAISDQVVNKMKEMLLN